MKNIIDYAYAEQAMLTEKPLGGVDSLILSTVSYLSFDGLIPGPDSRESVPLGSLLDSNMENTLKKHRDMENRRELLIALRDSRRFRRIRVMGYVNQFDEAAQKQFSAITFLLPDDTAYVAYRGTDDSVVGWKEDFNMTYLCPVPAQQESVRYLDRMARSLPCMLRTGGHSKGGNLAVYAAMECEPAHRARIVEIYNHDGPGFVEEIVEGCKYKTVESRIRLFVPRSSVVGMLLYQKGDYAVVESNRFWILQHDPFSWEVGDDDFRYAEKLSHSSLHLNSVLGDWLSDISMEQRELFIDSIYSVIAATSVNTVSEFSENWRINAVEALNAIREIDPETRKFLRQTIGALFATSFQWSKPLQNKLGVPLGRIHGIAQKMRKKAFEPSFDDTDMGPSQKP